MNITTRLELMDAVYKTVPTYLRNVYNELTEAQQQKLLDQYHKTKSNPEDLGFLIYMNFVK